jgi:hypothetical protein
MRCDGLLEPAEPKQTFVIDHAQLAGRAWSGRL